MSRLQHRPTNIMPLRRIRRRKASSQQGGRAEGAMGHDNRVVALDDLDFQAEAEAAARDIEIERDERIALSGSDELVAENDKLTKQVATLTRRVAALIEENGSLKYREKMWKKMAVAAGWKGRADG